MNARKFRISRRSITMAAAFVGLVSLAIGAHAALNKRFMESARAAVTVDDSNVASVPSRIALVIGNGHYPDAGAPLAQPINDARAVTSALRSDGFDVDVVEDATRDDMARAVERLTAKIRPDSVVMLYFGGYGVQVGRQSFMLPVDAAIWRERDIRRDGTSVEALLDGWKQRGARARLVVLDASRRNPYERRFRGYSRGLAPIDAADNTLVLSAATAGHVTDDAAGPNSLLATELLRNLTSSPASAETVFNNTRVAVTRASAGEQVPAVSSSLVEDVLFGSSATAKAGD
jgi:uncharacterized caspase-like protein